MFSKYPVPNRSESNHVVSTLTKALSNASIASESPTTIESVRNTPSAEIIAHLQRSQALTERRGSPTFIIGSASSHDAADEEMKRLHLFRTRQAARRGKTNETPHKTNMLLLKESVVAAAATKPNEAEREDPEVAEAFAAGMSL